MQPYLMTSPMPSRKKRSGKVARVSGSVRTASGWWKAPTRFLPTGRSTPVLPPTLASTWESSVVGTWRKGMPRRKVAAAKPPMSPVTPPPRVTMKSVRVKPCRARALYISSTVDSCLEASPAGNTKVETAKPAFSKEAFTRSP